MRIWMTGGTGFVGSNIVHEAVAAGHQVMTTVHSFVPPPGAGYATDRVDMTDAAAVAASVAAYEPDAVIHCAILNDHATMYADRKAGWDAYVTATRNTATAAHDTGASFAVISTDWVFDGTQGGADESTPPNPINIYGNLKMASELVAIERGGAVARVSGVNGVHRARPDTPRAQDAGFGYFVASIVDSLRAGQPFDVWMSDDINMIATPSLASDSARMVIDITKRRLTGIFHCSGFEPIERWELAEMACDVFDLDSSLLRTGVPDRSVMPDGPVPYDTSITRPRTDELLGPTAPLRELLTRFRTQYEAA